MPAGTRPANGYVPGRRRSGMRVTLLVDDERREFDDVTTAERHGYVTDGVRLTFADGRSEIVPGARLVRADAE